uniref:Pyridoxal-dependent decarboxylase domain-containing protein 1 n=1 Tax=Hirondellea gigas TaxID=1518452 RepID=A0A2P2HXS7_9CRUS
MSTEIQAATAAVGSSKRSDAELAQEALDNQAKELKGQRSKQSQTDETDGEEDNGIETEEDEEDEDEERDGHFSALAKFSKEFLDVLAEPNGPLPEEERKSKPLMQSQKDYKEVLRLLQDLVQYDSDEPEVTYGVECPDSLSRVSVTSHLVSAALTTLHPHHLRRLATRLLSDTSLWISRLFRKFESATCITDDQREGVVRVGRMLLHSKYPRYAADGHQALYARPPLIYVAATAHTSLPLHLATALGIGSSSVRVVPCNTVVGSPVAMDTAALDRILAADLAAQKKPLMVIANVGGGVVGGVDNVTRIQEICQSHDVWLHVEGHNLAALTLPNSPNLPASVGDSMTLPLGMWLGVPALPFVTVYRVLEATSVHAAGLTALNLQVRVDTLQLWITLLSLGSSGVSGRMMLGFELAQQLQNCLSEHPRIRLLSPEPVGAPPYTSIGDLISRPISTAQLLETVCGTVVFQYVPENMKEGRNSEYYDNLNSWLGQVVRREVAGFIPLELVSLEGAGLVLRWSPLEGPYTHHLTPSAVEELIRALHQQIDILNATVKQREMFSALVSKNVNLQLAEIPQWAGLGGVRYIPDVWLSQEPLPDSAKEDVNYLNSHLVEQLKATDSAFSLGEGSDGLGCVRFGMVTDDTDLEELLALVLTTGKGIESSSKFLEQMTQVVKKGIETATEDLKRESDEKIWQEGLLRHVPIFGSVYNWLSPPTQQGIRGRTLDLNAGVLESTENIYKYHMQIRHGEAPSHDTKLPPAPLVQTSVTPSPSTPSHSRNSSAASAARRVSESSNTTTGGAHPRQGSAVSQVPQDQVNGSAKGPNTDNAATTVRPVVENSSKLETVAG